MIKKQDVNVLKAIKEMVLVYVSLMILLNLLSLVLKHFLQRILQIVNKTKLLLMENVNVMIRA